MSEEKCVVINTINNPIDYGPNLFISIYLFEKVCKEFIDVEINYEQTLVKIIYENGNINIITVLNCLADIIKDNNYCKYDKDKIKTCLDVIFTNGYVIFNGVKCLLMQTDYDTIWDSIPYVCIEEHTT